MPNFSKRSLDNLSTCAPALQRIAKEAIGQVDFSVICGHRGEEEQNKAFKEGHSKLRWPHSSHNKQPSRAFDLVPWPIDWEDRERFFFLAGVILAIARRDHTELVWGGAWNGSLNKPGQFDDLVHYELD